MTVVTSFPLGEVVQSQDAMGRTAKWALKLMDQGIMYASQTVIKSQVLADFIVEWTEVQMPPAVIDQEYWTMYLMRIPRGDTKTSPKPTPFFINDPSKYII